MRCTLSTTTEDRIKEAAKVVFLEKGFDGTTTRDIANAAGINSALMNYYFRSKEKLFDAIFNDVSTLMFDSMIGTLDEPISLQEKISRLVDIQFQTMRMNPNLTIFIMNELHRNPERMLTNAAPLKQIVEYGFQKQIDQEVALGRIAPISAHHVLSMIIANTHFLFVSKSMTMMTQGMDEHDFDAFANRHQVYVKEMICNYLFSSQPAC